MAAVPFGAVGPLHRLPEQLLDAIGIAPPFLVADDTQRQHAGIPLEHLGGGVVGAVVQNQELVLPREAGKDLANLPEQKPDGRGLVVARYTDVNHEPSREWAHER